MNIHKFNTILILLLKFTLLILLFIFKLNNLAEIICLVRLKWYIMFILQVKRISEWTYSISNIVIINLFLTGFILKNKWWFKATFALICSRTYAAWLNAWNIVVVQWKLILVEIKRSKACLFLKWEVRPTIRSVSKQLLLVWLLRYPIESWVIIDVPNISTIFRLIQTIVLMVIFIQSLINYREPELFFVFGFYRIPLILIVYLLLKFIWLNVHIFSLIAKYLRV